MIGKITIENRVMANHCSPTKLYIKMLEINDDPEKSYYVQKHFESNSKENFLKGEHFKKEDEINILLAILKNMKYENKEYYNFLKEIIYEYSQAIDILENKKND